MAAGSVITSAVIEDVPAAPRRMRLATLGRILRHGLPRTGAEAPWGLRELGRHIATTHGQRRRFAWYVMQDLKRYLRNDPAPVEGEAFERAQLAAEWLARA